MASTPQASFITEAKKTSRFAEVTGANTCSRKPRMIAGGWLESTSDNVERVSFSAVYLLGSCSAGFRPIAATLTRLSCLWKM